MTEDKDNKKEFADKYLYNLHAKVMPVVKDFEKERKIRFIISLTLALIVAAIAITVVVLLIYASYNSDYATQIKPFAKIATRKFLPIALFVGFFLWKKIQQDFEYKIKNKIMPQLISAFEGFTWVDMAPDEYYDDMLNSDIFPYYDKKITHAYTDYFYGSYKDVFLEFSQAVYDAKKYDFSGGIIRINMNKNFVGETILRPRGVYCKDLAKMGLQKVTLEDSEFNKKFDIYSTDQVEARYLLTPSFMERLKNISVQFTKSNKIYCAFKENCIYIAPESKNDMFSLFGLTKRTDNMENFNILFAQVFSVIELVEYLKLNEKTGI